MENRASYEKPGRIKSLLDKYRSLAIVTALLILSLSSFAQIQSGALQYINAKGYVWKQGGFDSSLRMPMDTFKLRVSDSGSIAYKNNLWIWNGYRWKGACSCSSDTSAPVTPPFSFLTQPTNQTAASGDAVPFYFKVQNGIGPYKYQIHYLATSSTSTTSTETNDSYTFFPTATTTENLNFSAIDLGGNDTILSNTVTLTVTAPSPVITYGWSATDPYTDNSTAPTVSNSATSTITSGANLSLNYSSAAVDKFLIIKIPASQPTPTTWYSTSFNNGSIPDATFRAVFTVGSFKYLVSRDGAGVAFDPSVPFQFNH